MGLDAVMEKIGEVKSLIFFLYITLCGQLI